MENFCLCSQLKGKVINDTLPTYEALRFYIPSSVAANSVLASLKVNEHKEYMFISNKEVFNVDGNSSKTSKKDILIDTNTSIRLDYATDEPCFVDMRDVYYLTSISYHNSSFVYVLFDDLKFLSNLQKLTLSRVTAVSQNIDKLSFIENLNSVTFDRSKVWGKIEDFCESFIANFPNKNKEILMLYYLCEDNGKHVTFNNNVFANSYECKIVFSNNTCSVYNNAEPSSPILMGSYDGTTWNYV